MAPIDVPPFDRSNVDGFAVRSADLASAGEGAPVRADAQRRSDRLRHRADAAGAVGHRDLDRDRRSGAARRRRHRHGRAHPAGGHPRDRDPPRRLARAVRVLCRLRHRARRGAAARRHRDRLARDRHAGGLRHRAGVASRAGRASRSSPPATNWCSPASRCARPRSTTPTARSSPRRSRENGGEARFLGAIPDDEAALEAAMREALATSDMLVLSGGTSKGAGDVSHRIIGRLGKPGIIAHGVALKPGKPLCLAVCDGKPVVILPGFPTSAMFTFHDMIVPVLRRMAGLPPRSDAKVTRKRAGADRLRTRPHRIRHGVAGRRDGRADRLSDRQGLRRDHVLRAGRRLSAASMRWPTRCRRAARPR